jgi:DNA invertase Pin-like site-specific DNA recombinase
MKSYIAYYRVSTDKQGKSGLGLDAQRAAVAGFLGQGKLVAEFTEVETGKGVKALDRRPQLRAALEACRKQKAMLVIAKLDRLARNVAFISSLLEAGVEFVAVDMPHANRLTIHILAAVAEHEREMISQRTKAALAEAKKRGTKLGNPNPKKASRMGVAAMKELAARKAANVRPIIEAIRTSGISTLQGIAEALNARGVPTARGRTWHPATVARVMG